MERTILSVCLVCALITLFASNQPGTTRYQAQVDSPTETLLGLDKGSQVSVSAPLAALQDANAVKLGPETLDFSATMHGLTKHMLGLSPERRSKVTGLAAQLASEDGHIAPKPLKDVSDHLTLLASTIDALTNEERETLVSLATSLALTK